jgi:uncharacterized protein YjbI with pentapeptide repeats
MTSPSIKRTRSQEGNRLFPLRLRLTLPLVTRRCAAVVVEVALVAASALVPYSIGLYAKEHYKGETVPINPVLSSTQEVIAETLAKPVRDSENRQVPPLTNLFWCGALVLPVAVGGWQLYLLAKTGKTSPKSWFGVRVVTGEGDAPGFLRAAWREGVGRWGLPVGTAYLLWRYTGAFPDGGILLGLAGLMLLAEGASSLFNSRRRTFHDKFAGTYVLDGNETFSPYLEDYQRRRSPAGGNSVTLEVENPWPQEEPSRSSRRQRNITKIVLTSQQPHRRPLNLWLWMRSHPGLTLLIIAVSGMISILGTFVGTQVYIQSQANRREFKKQDNQVFLALVKQLSTKSATAVEERQGAILALARLDDPRTVPFLVDLLGQEKNPALMDAIQQALVSSGVQALPAVQRLNQSLQNDQETLRRKGTPVEQQLVALRLRATSRAIAKILTVYTDKIHKADLSRTNLGQISKDATQFTLVLDNLNLSGVNFESANLYRGSFRNSRFYGVGEDQRFGTFDDWITNFNNADLKEADFTGAVLNNVSMNRAIFIRATLNKANLSNSQMASANLSSAKLIGADLRQTNLENASLTGADLGEAKLARVNLNGARLGQINAAGGDFSFANLTESNWQGADLVGANFSNADLQNAELSSTNLFGAVLKNAKLQNAKLQNANLSAADLRGANLTGADFKGVVFAPPNSNQSNQFIEMLPGVSSAARIKGVNFAKVKNLNNQQLRFICNYGGRHPQCP